jgi:Ca2+-binding RTX toxin-like protein
VAVAAGTAPADAGDVYQANITVDVQVQGTPPPGATITIVSPDAEPAESVEFPLADAAGTDDAFFVQLLIYRNVYVTDAAGAADLWFDCFTTQDVPTDPNSSCSGESADEDVDRPHADIYFQPGANRLAHVTITLRYQACDGRAGTVSLANSEQPTPGADVIVGSPVADTVNGLGGSDVICGNGGGDTLRGGDGLDRILGQGGDDRLEGGPKGDRLFGGAGRDLLLGQAGLDALDGGALRDTCNGGTERDTGTNCEVRSSIP